MSLADYEPITTVIEIGSNGGPIKIAIRGISTDDLTRIFNAQFDEIKVAFALWQKAMMGQFTEIAFFNTLVMKTPALVAEIISVAAGEQDQRARAAKLPLGAQVLLLTEIHKMTLKDVGGLKNLMAILGKAKDELPPLPALPGSLPSGANAAQH